MKKCKFFSIILSFFTIFSLFLASCDTVEIGLGSSVDTRAPELTIQNPPAGSIIRDVFAIRGTCEDDGTIASITVELKQTDNSTKDYTVSGTFNQKDGIWWCEINPLDEKNPIPDGQYEAIVTIKDNAKRETIRSRPFTIDNTAPVLALTRPSSIIPTGSDPEKYNNSSDFDSFGQDFVIEGHVADTSERRYISVDVYDMKGVLKYSTLNATEEASKRLKIDSDFSTTIASFGDEAYTAIYGDDDEAGTKKFFCEITVYDNAKKYPIDGSTPTGDNLVGNKVNYFYMYEGDLYNSIFDSYGMTNAYKLLNDSFSDDDSRTLDINLSPENAKKELENKENQETRGFLSLNPKNNPYFKVSGHDPLNKEDMENGTVFDDTENHITNNSNIVVEIYPGLDQTPLIQDNIGLYLIPADYYGKPVENAEKIWLIHPLVDEKGDPVITDEAEIAERKSLISKIGSTYKLTYYLTTRAPTIEGKNLYSGEKYLFGVQGWDKKGVPVKNADSVLGFMLVESGTAPSITIMGVTPKWVTTNENTEENPDLVSKDAVKTITVSMAFSGDAPFRLTRIINDGAEEEIYKGSDDYIEDKYTPPAGAASGKIKYSISGNNNLSNTEEVEFNVDNERPAVLTILVPTVFETAKNSYKFSGTATDGDSAESSKIAKVEMRLSGKKADNSSVSTEWITVGNSENWDHTVVFQEDEVLKEVFVTEGNKKIEVRAIDVAGNISEIEEKSFVYDTSLPKLTVQNYKMGNNEPQQIKGEFYVSESFSISGTAEDQYGIESIVVKQITGEGENEKEITIPVEVDAEGKWIVEKLPRNTEPGKTDEALVETGVYNYKITVTDLTGLKKETSSLYKVIIDLEPPVVTITSPEKDMNVKLNENGMTAISGTNYRFTGTMNDGNGTGITGYSYKLVKAGQDEAKIDWKNENTTSSSWSFYNELATGTDQGSSSSLTEGIWSLFVKAIDEAGNKSATVERKFVVDQSNPLLEADITKSENCVNNNSVWYYKNELSGTIRYSDTFGMDDSSTYPYTFKYGDYDITPAVKITNGSWRIDSSLFSECKGFEEGFDFAALTDSERTLSITVYDKVGKTSVKTFKVCKDNTAPVVTALPVTNAALSYQKSVNYTFSGTAKDANLEEVTAVLYKNGVATSEEGFLSPSGENGDWEWKVYNLEEASYSIKVTAKDKANNKTEYVTGSIMVDTTAPKTTVNGTALFEDDGTTAVTTLTDGTKEEIGKYFAQTAYSLSGSVIDSNFEYNAQSVMLKENGIEKEVTFAGSGTDEEPYIWSYTPASFSDGTYSYTITITDKAENKTIYSLSIVYDTSAPELTITSPLNNSAYGNMPAANGKATDAGIGIKTVKWSTNNSENDSDWTATEWTTVTDWSADLGTMENEGSVTLYVKATDNFGRTTKKDVSFSYDLYNPEVVETDSVTEYQKKGYNFTLTGTAGDTNALDCITISEGAVVYGSTNTSDSTATARITSENAAVTLSELSANTALTAESGKGKAWRITFSDQEQTSPQSPLTLAAGSHKFSIIAKDSSGKVSTEIIKNIFVDTIAPEVLGVNTPSTLQTANASFRFEGTAKDNLNGTTDSRVKNVKVMFKSYNSNSDDATVTASTDWLDANGDTSWNFLAVFTDDSVNEVFGNNEGFKTISVKAFDYAGNESAILESSKFLYDRDIPNISLITYTIGSESPVSLSTTDNFFAKESFKLNITSQDGYLVKKIAVKQKKGNVTKTIYLADNINLAEKTDVVENLPRDVSAISAEDEDATETGALTLDENSSGEYEYIIEVTDAAGKKASDATIRVKIDKKKPTITLETELDEPFYQGNSKTFTFTAQDPVATDGSSGSGLSKYYYKFTQNSSAQTINPANWTEKTASTSFEIIPSLISGNTLGVNGELNEGKWTLWYYVKDNAGNESEQKSAEFWLDQSAPSLVVNNLVEGKTNPVDEEVTDSGYTISGTVSDSNAIAIAGETANEVITIKVEGVKVAAIPSSALTGTNSNEWSYTIPKASINENGLTEIEIIAKDIVGKTSSKNYNLYYDTEAPELEVTAPVDGEQVGNGSDGTASKIIKGTIRDEGYGLARLEFVLKDGSGNIVKDSDEENAKEVSGYWAATDTGSISAGNYPIKIKGEQWFYAGQPDQNGIITGNAAEKIPLGIKEGTLKLEVTATEKVVGTHNARTDTETVTFFYDAAEPVITESGSVSRITNKDFDLYGTAYDTNQLEKIEIYQGGVLKATTVTDPAPASGVNTITFKESSADDAADVTLASATSDSTKGTWKAVFNASDYSDGDYIFNITATDISGKVTTVTRTIQMDKTPPVNITTSVTTSNTEIGTGENKKNWYNTRSISISVSADDSGGSGVSSAEYTKDKPDAATRSWTTIPNNGSSFVGTVTFQNDGANTYYVRVTDIAGNCAEANNGEIVSETVYIDSAAPGEAKVTSVDNVAAGSGENQFGGSKLTNGSSAIVFTMTAKDTGTVGTNATGIGTETDSVKIIKVGNEATEIEVTGTSDESGVWSGSATIPASVINSSGGVVATVTDVVGNSYDFTLFQIQYDNKYPTVTMGIIADADTSDTGENAKTQINGTTTISGTASDDQTLVSVKLEYAIKTGETTWSAWQDTGLSNQGTIYSWSFKVNTTESPYSDNDTVRFRVLAKDAAGNEGNSGNTTTAISSDNYKEVVISQDTDRPIIKINNLEMTTPVDTNYYWHKYDTMYGTVSDDDGTVTSVKYKVHRAVEIETEPTDDQGNSIWETVSQNYYTSFTCKDDEVVTGAFVAGTYYTKSEFSTESIYNNGMWEISSLGDGQTWIYFEVQDAEKRTVEKTFSSNENSTSSSSYGPKIKDSTGAAKLGYSGTEDDILKVKVDTAAPEVISEKYYLSDSSSYNNATDWASANNIGVLSTTKCGGKDKFLYVRVETRDSNGIDTARTAIKFNNTTATSTADGDTFVPVRIIQQNTSGTTVTTIVRIDLSQFNSGTNNFAIDLYDKAGKSTKETKSILIDNTAPELMVSNYTAGVMLYGSNTNSFRLYQNGDSDISKFYFYVTDNSSFTPEYNPASNTYTGFTEMDDQKVGTTTTVFFDGGTTSAVEYHAPKFYNIIQALTGKSDDQMLASDAPVPLWFWFYAVDDLGNASVPSAEKSFAFNVFPNGDKPRIDITYPARNQTEQNAPVSVGGTIRVTGYTEISTDTVDAVYVQIDPSYNYASAANLDGNVFNEAGWKTELETAIEGKNVSYRIVDLRSESLYGTDIPADSPYRYAIKVSGTMNWSFNLNSRQEVNDDNNYVAIRAFAVSSTNHKISEPVTHVVKIDANAPLIGNTKPLELVKYANADGTGGVIGRQVYTTDMYLKGIWYLEGSIEHESGIKIASWSYSEYEGSTWVAKDDDIVDGETYDSDRLTVNSSISTSTAYNNYNFKLRVGHDGDDCGTLNYTLSITDGRNTGAQSVEEKIRINYDNRSPVLNITSSSSNSSIVLAENEAGDKISNIIVQSNGTFTIEGNVNESGAGQSGFNKVAMFYTREVGESKTINLVDPMLDSEQSGIANYEAVTGLTYKSIEEGGDGLYWRTAQGTLENNEITLTTIGGEDIANVTNFEKIIRNGGLCKINDVIYRISTVNVSTKKITVEGSIENINESTTMYFAAGALIIDHKSAEGGAAYVDAVGNTQYYTTATYNPDGPYDKGNLKLIDDDGDQMIESATRNGTAYNWSASINSSNIHDGIVTAHFVAFDNAGNVSYKAFKATVSNNAPRIAGVIYGTDSNGNGVFDSNELIDTYHHYYTPLNNIQNKGNGYNIGQKNTSCEIGNNSNALVVKGDLIVKPEIVGGNDGLGYTYSYEKDDDGTYESNFIDYEGVGNANETDIRTDDLSITIPLSVFLTEGQKVKQEEAQAMKFIIWDKTEGTIPGDKSGRADITLWTKVSLVDNKTPENKINRFHWASTTDNSIYYENEVAQGHIELEDDWINAPGYIANPTNGEYEYDANPKVSGIIILDGVATDETCVEQLSVYISGTNGSINGGNEIVFAKRDRTGAENSTRGQFINTNAVDGIQLHEDVEDTFNNTTGTNTVKWKIRVDTSKLSTIAESDVIIRAGAYDRGSPSLSNGNVVYPETGNQFEPAENLNSTGIGTEGSPLTALYKVDVVPYISKVETKLSESLKSSIRNAYSRTALGHYIVSYYPNADENETILIEGFNLGNATNQPIYNGNYLDVTAAGKVKLPVESINTSGPLVLKVNNIETLNNKNNNNACGSYKTETTQITEASSYSLKSKYAYNRMPNGTSNNLLTDDVVFDVWQFDSDAAKPMSGELREPSMKINPVTGEVGLAFVSGPADIAIAGNDGTDDYSYTRWQNNFASFSNISFVYDALGYAHATANGIDTNPQKYHAGRFSYFYNKWGPSDLDPVGSYTGKNAVRLESIAVPKLAGEKETLYTVNTNTSYKDYLAKVAVNEKLIEKNTNYKILINGTVPTTDSLTETRFYSPSLAATVHDDATAVYLAYYDSIQKQIRFRYSSAVPQNWQSDLTYENMTINEDKTITVDDNYNAKWISGAKLSKESDGTYKGDGGFTKLHHDKNDKDDFVDNLGYYSQSSSGGAEFFENYMEANTDHFSLIAGKDTQQGEAISEVFSSREVTVNKTDADGKKLHKKRGYRQIRAINNDGTLKDTVNKPCDDGTIEMTDDIKNAIKDEELRNRFVVGQSYDCFTRSSGTYNWIIQPDCLIYYSTDGNSACGYMTHILSSQKAHEHSYGNRKLDPDENYPVYEKVSGLGYDDKIPQQEPYIWPWAKDDTDIVKVNIPVYETISYNVYDTGYTGYKYVAIDAITKDTSSEDPKIAQNDIVVAVWYDGTGCRYAYNPNPTSKMDNNTNESISGWKGNKVIFREGGEHCTVKVDSLGGIHIAAYADGSLKYAYLPKYDATYNETTDSVIVDSYTITGERLNLDVGLEKIRDTSTYVAVPYISYYNGTARMPTVAKLVVPEDGVMNYKASGTIRSDGSEIFTGNWEISLVPTASTLTSQYYDKMNIGLWKVSGVEGDTRQKGLIVASNDNKFTISKSKNSKNDNTSSATNGKIYGNGTKNPIVGYAIESMSGTYLETAQMK